MSDRVGEPNHPASRLSVQGSVEMNENRRILLLALGIMMIIASDPPVVARSDRSYSACGIVRSLAVSAFDSLVRSTLPLSTDFPEGERTEEVLVAESTTRPAKRIAAVPAPVISADRSRSGAATSDFRIVSTSAESLQTACNGSTRSVAVLRIEAVMDVHGSAPSSRS